MSEDPIDDLLALYRRSAREAPSPHVDARILRAAERARSARRAWPWTAAAVLAASVLLGVFYGVLRVSAPVAPPATAVPSGYEEGRLAAYLMSMDVPEARAERSGAMERAPTDLGFDQ